ncbi:MAG: nitroreductase family protein, partial [Defluviitaleaceae bacterium]|nr:nitroreductase family protein [Defluviitaleaceae bacterium]
MNDTINSLMKRRSVRDFQPAQIPDSDLGLIIDAGLRAASAMNQQPWHLTVAQKKEVIDAVVEFQKDCLRESGDPARLEQARSMEGRHSFYHAPTVIFVSEAPGAGFGLNDCGNVCQNMCVAAYSLGLGSCYIASF